MRLVIQARASGLTANTAEIAMDKPKDNMRLIGIQKPTAVGSQLQRMVMRSFAFLNAFHILKFLKDLKKKRIDKCLQKNENDPNAFLFIKGQKVYRDFNFAMQNLPCSECKYPPTIKGHDHCLKNLPGVENACCGHGDRELSYIAFKNGRIIRGFFLSDD